MSDVERDGSGEMGEQEDQEVYDDVQNEQTILELKKVVCFSFIF